MEFKKWLGYERIKVFSVSSEKRVEVCACISSCTVFQIVEDIIMENVFANKSMWSNW